jgi:2-oxoglutarate dehydrogenase E2 component (dihydrolipoamide succinyltransferase)
MRVKMVMPQMGESIAEGTIAKWLKSEGETVEKDENILEISTDKVDSEIPSPASGRIAKVLVPEGETVDVGTVIAEIETDADVAIEDSATPAEPAESVEAAPAPESPVPQPVASTTEVTAAAPRPAPEVEGRRDGGRFYSPLVRSLAREHGVSPEELDRIPGTGRGGRVTKKDLETYIETRSKVAGPPATPSAEPAPLGETAFVQPPGIPSVRAPLAPTLEYHVSESQDSPYGRVDVVPMDIMRKKIAEHMVMSKATSAHVYSVIEVDMTRTVEHRESNKAPFQHNEGFKLTYTPYFVEGTMRALREFPFLNASIDGENILLKRFINIGVAVALDDGLIVPVVKRADSYNFVGLARVVNDLAQRARDKKLKPDEVQGGTFTITNMGGFGTLYGIPIISQPQVAILGIGAIQKRPVVVGDSAIGIRDMVYLSLSFDHRLVDGAMAGQFLARLKWELENLELPKLGG